MGYKEAMEYFYARYKEALDKIVISLKQNLRIINKTTNIYQHFDITGNRIYKNRKLVIIGLFVSQCIRIQFWGGEFAKSKKRYGCL